MDDRPLSNQPRCTFGEGSDYSQQHAVADLSAIDSLTKYLKGFFPNFLRIDCSFELFDSSFVTQGVDKFLSTTGFFEFFKFLTQIKNIGYGIRFFSLQGFVHVEASPNRLLIHEAG